jgi:hypothetical protein
LPSSPPMPLPPKMRNSSSHNSVELQRLRRSLEHSEHANAKRLSLSLAPPRWKTREFYVYYVIVIVSYLYMIKVAVDVGSEEKTETWNALQGWLHEGWIPGRKLVSK